jgi:hypothetical protein
VSLVYTDEQRSEQRNDLLAIVGMVERVEPGRPLPVDGDGEYAETGNQEPDRSPSATVTISPLEQRAESLAILCCGRVMSV